MVFDLTIGNLGHAGADERQVTGLGLIAARRSDRPSNCLMLPMPHRKSTPTSAICLHCSGSGARRASHVVLVPPIPNSASPDACMALTDLVGSRLVWKSFMRAVVHDGGEFRVDALKDILKRAAVEVQGTRTDFDLTIPHDIHDDLVEVCYGRPAETGRMMTETGAQHPGSR